MGHDETPHRSSNANSSLYEEAQAGLEAQRQVQQQLEQKRLEPAGEKKRGLDWIGRRRYRLSLSKGGLFASVRPVVLAPLWAVSIALMFVMSPLGPIMLYYGTPLQMGLGYVVMAWPVWFRFGGELAVWRGVLRNRSWLERLPFKVRQLEETLGDEDLKNEFVVEVEFECSVPEAGLLQGLIASRLPRPQQTASGALSLLTAPIEAHRPTEVHAKPSEPSAEHTEHPVLDDVSASAEEGWEPRQLTREMLAIVARCPIWPYTPANYSQYAYLKRLMERVLLDVHARYPIRGVIVHKKR